MGKRYHRSRRPYYHSHDVGNEFARQHIEEYRQLEQELGGTIDDVKEYFFSLSPRQLQSILGDYGRKYGEQAQAYAAKTIAKWEAGHVHMSGLVARRLFDFLPPINQYISKRTFLDMATRI